MMHNFKKLKVWNDAMTLVTEVYILTNTFPKDERFGIVSQINRAAVSIPSNIAEGTSRSSQKDFARFIEIAIGSCFELETQINLSFRLEYVSQEKHAELEMKIIDLQKMLFGLKQSLINSFAN